MLMRIVTNEEMRHLEEKSIADGISVESLMQNAGLAVALHIKEITGTLSNIPVLVLIGPGNNGGDGLIAADHLNEWGAEVTAYIALPRKKSDTVTDPQISGSLTIIEAENDPDLHKFRLALSKSLIVIDAILGTGVSRPITGILKKLLVALEQEHCSRSDLNIIAVDVPTGVNPDTGGCDPIALTADSTIALGYPKVATFAFPGAERFGKLRIADIGMYTSTTEETKTHLITQGSIRHVLPKRPLNSHKGTFGRVLVVAGSSKYIGAACLACEAAARTGAGIVTLAIPESLHTIVASKLTETTYLILPEKNGQLLPSAADLILKEIEYYDSFLIGCGIGQEPGMVQLVKRILLESGELKIPSVLDADCINIISSMPEWWSLINDQSILTPHVGEMSRLTGKTTDEIGASRMDITKNSALEWQKSVVLKGAFTAVSSVDGSLRISPFANPGLSSAGTGDVLAGCIAGLLAQGIPPFEAASSGVFIHGLAGERVKMAMGDTGMIASDLIPILPLVIKHIKEDNPRLD